MPAMNSFNKGPNGPMRLYVGSLHFNITEDMLRSIFEPFGKIEHMQLMIDTETGRSKGYGFITVSVLDQLAEFFQHQPVPLHYTWLTLFPLLVSKCRRCEKSNGTIKWVRTGWPAYENQPRDGAFYRQSYLSG